ncbi:hypothetical protein CEUSTIGMA_g9010.t1 [Chlamydomonas eustigma]|uniref:Uncharacterized protein n=1 Tax=Chlamydomonas eustigma TaxID=1157962 RepID=A0A250XFA3_9CHLO|nr:hypothetical protein CEUSTIGMA_g9010.t1 [Chlamydomonas eustigma]|eukprot:GAX81582.1 hypothetical protein CEUSTIGMA_g9010.t1 [Chlamydomonas eustigma]
MSDQFYNMMEELAIQKMATEIPQYRQAGANTEKMEAQLRRVQANREIRQQIQLQIQMLKKQLHQVMPPSQQSQIKNYVAASSSIQTAQLPLRMAENQGLVMNNILQHHHDQGQLLYPGHDAPSKAAMMSTSQQQQQNNPEASSSLISRVPINSQLGSVPELPIGTNNSAITSAGYYQDAAALLINHGTWLNPAKALAGSTASPPLGINKQQALAGSTASPPLGINKQQPLFLPPENGLDHLVTTQWPHHDVVTYPNNVVVPTTPSLVPHYGGGGGYYNQLQTTPLDNILLEYYHKYGEQIRV